MKSKQTLKVGQKYRVIKDCEDACCEGTIITVDRILDDGWFWDKEIDLGFNLKHDKLQLITPKKKFKEIKEIKPFKTLFWYQNYPDLCAKQTDEFKKWVKQVTDTINLLIKKL